MTFFDAYHFLVTTFAIVMTLGIIKILTLRSDGSLSHLRQFFWIMLASFVGVWCVEVLWLAGLIDDIWWLQEFRKNLSRTVLAVALGRLLSQLL